MSCPRNQGCGSRYTRKVDNRHTSNCKSSCPGRKNEENNCPHQKKPTSASREEDRCVTRCTQTQLTLISVSSGELPAGCPGPMIIQVPTVSNGAKADLRIELYIHQSPPGQDDLHKTVQAEVRASAVGSNDPEEARRRSYGNRSSADRSYGQNETDERNEEIRISDGGVATADTTEGEKLENSIPPKDLGSYRRNNDKKFHRGFKQDNTYEISETSRKIDKGIHTVDGSEGEESRSLAPSNILGGSRRRSNDNRSFEIRDIQSNEIVQPREDLRNNDDEAVNITEVKENESSASSTDQEGSQRRGNGNISTVDKGSWENENDQPRLGFRNDESVTSDNTERDKNRKSGPTGVATDKTFDILMSRDQNDEILEENIAVEKAEYLENAARKSVIGPESEIVYYIDRQGNIRTDGIYIAINISAKNMVDESTQA